MMVSLIRLCFSLVFVLPGNIMIFPLSNFISFYAEGERIKALKASVVKIKGNDVLATTKTVAYISTFPIYLAMFTYIFHRILITRYLYDRSDAFNYTLIFIVLFPIV
jgi:hypothetical protein